MKFLLNIPGLFASALIPAIAFAQENAAEQPGFGEIFSKMMPMFVMILFIWYFMVIKPQQSKQKSHQTLLSSLKKGDRVITTSGIIGRIAGTEEDYIQLEVSNGVKIKIQSSHIAKQYEPEKKTEKKKAA